MDSQTLALILVGAAIGNRQVYESIKGVELPGKAGEILQHIEEKPNPAIGSNYEGPAYLEILRQYNEAVKREKLNIFVTGVRAARGLMQEEEFEQWFWKQVQGLR